MIIESHAKIQWAVDHGKLFDVLSPDGFSIDPDKTYKTVSEATTAQRKWQRQFKDQGYYSSNGGRLELWELENYCTLKIIL